MVASPILADSSFYIQLLRQGLDPLKALAAPAAASDLVVCGIVRCEVGRALRSQKVRERFGAFWDVSLNVPADARLWLEVEETLWGLDRRGIVLPVTDVVIACSAKRVGAVVLTLDHHFYEIPGVQVTSRVDW